MSFRRAEDDMANCVSCGREIEPGSLFCEQCYAKMKGRRGPMRDVAGTAAGRQDEGRPGVSPQGGTVPGTGGTVRRAAGLLTPADQKKVVSIRPDLEKNAKDKYGKSKKRFTITITFSEKTYAMLSRLSRRKGEVREGAAASGEGGPAPLPERRKAAHRRKGPHGRPALKAVSDRKGAGSKRKEGPVGFKGWIAQRERKWDRGDYAAMALAAAAGILIFSLSFAGWVEVGWGAAEGPTNYKVSIKGVDLGALSYLIIVLAVIALLYIPTAWRLERWLRHLDFGVVLLLTGILIIVLFYTAIAPNQKMMDIAYRLANQRGIEPAGEQVHRQTLAAAYLISFAGVLMAFSGLVRLSERREEAEKSGEGEAKRVG